MKEPPSYTLLLNIFSDRGLYIFSIVGIILLALSAIISASEAAYFSITSQDLERFKASNDKRDKVIASLLARPRLLLVSLIVLNTLTYVSTITVSTLLMKKAVSPSPVEWFLIFLLDTIVITFISEIVARVYGSCHKLRIARLTVFPWKIWVGILKPFAIFLIKVNSFIEKKFEKNGTQATAGELNQALELATESTITSDGDKGFLRGIMNFGTLTVNEVMRFRSNISAIDIEINFQELIDYINKTGFARIPVYRKTIDTIAGVLYTKDLLPFLEEEKNYAWQHLIRPGFFVSETKKISSLLKDFQEKHVHMAIVINDARVTLGLVTLEDLVEEIIGNIKQDTSENALPFEKLDEKTFVLNGKVLLSELYSFIPLQRTVFNPAVDDKSLSDLLLEHFNKLPDIGDRFIHGPLTFVVESVDQKKIKRLRIQIE